MEFGSLVNASTTSVMSVFMLLIVAFVADMEPKSTMDMVLIPNMDTIDIVLGSSEKGNVVPSAKPRKKTMTSVYLKYFETAPDGKTRRCKFCAQSYSIATATGKALQNCFVLPFAFLCFHLTIVAFYCGSGLWIWYLASILPCFSL